MKIFTVFMDCFVNPYGFPRKDGRREDCLKSLYFLTKTLEGKSLQSNHCRFLRFCVEKQQNSVPFSSLRDLTKSRRGVRCVATRPYLQIQKIKKYCLLPYPRSRFIVFLRAVRKYSISLKLWL